MNLSSLTAVTFVALTLFTFGCSDDSENEAEAVTCSALCSRTIDCPNDPDPDCVSDCANLKLLCPTELDANLVCFMALPDSNLECDDEQETSIREGLCSNEQTALAACFFAAIES